MIPLAIPLAKAALCVSCPTIFEVLSAPDPRCPRCTSGTFVMLYRILNRVPAAAKTGEC